LRIFDNGQWWYITKLIVTKEYQNQTMDSTQWVPILQNH
jgi:hypothetical protein